MFKSIQWKIITIFLLLTLLVMIVVGTFLLQNISAYYHDDFATTLSAQAFTPAVCSELDTAARSMDPIGEITEIMNVYSIRMMIDSYRNYYILSSDGARVLSSSDPFSPSSVDITPNLISAMDGKVGSVIDRSASYMDYAYPISVRGEVNYIAYIVDSKDELYDIIRNIFINILWALVFGMLISAFLGLILSRTIIMPISNLQIRAEQLSEGEFGHRIEVRSRDEIGRLTMAFNDMASRIDRSLSDISAEKNKVEAILSQMTDGIVAFDQTGEMIHSNSAARELSGVDYGADFKDFVKAINVDLTLEQLNYLDRNRVVERQCEIGKRIIRVLFAPYADEEDKNGGTVVVMQDITEQTKLDMARREFVANVSHELRTPITTIKSYAETILDMAEEETPETGFIKVIEQEADRMTRIVTDLLTLSRLDNSSKQALDKKVFDLASLVENVVQKLKINANNLGLTLSFEKEGDTSAFYGDQDRMEQVITNIVSNAVKYTPSGGNVRVSCSAKYTEAVICVADDGIGIPEKDLPRIFERFYRVDKARSRESGGTGLGLAIAKELVEMHGGRIEIKSREGKGTSVIIKVPMINV
ncbi:MAG: HAMP domain-containing protein [Clostridia bacterium]|nr:HAMP domain-containing protein [Clostridia bacterium]